MTSVAMLGGRMARLTTNSPAAPRVASGYLQRGAQPNLEGPVAVRGHVSSPARSRMSAAGEGPQREARAGRPPPGSRPAGAAVLAGGTPRTMSWPRARSHPRGQGGGPRGAPGEGGPGAGRPRRCPRRGVLLPRPGLHGARHGAAYSEGREDQQQQALQAQAARVTCRVDFRGAQRARERQGERRHRSVVHRRDAPERRSSTSKARWVSSDASEPRKPAPRSGRWADRRGQARGEDQESLQERLHGWKG